MSHLNEEHLWLPLEMSTVPVIEQLQELVGSDHPVPGVGEVLYPDKRFLDLGVDGANFTLHPVRTNHTGEAVRLRTDSIPYCYKTTHSIL